MKAGKFERGHRCSERSWVSSSAAAPAGPHVARQLGPDWTEDQVPVALAELF